MKEKICFCCQRSLPLASFYKHPMMADGHLGKCKECQRANSKKNYHKNFKARRRYEKARNQSPERKEKVRKYTAAYRKRNPDKYRARTAVHNALRDGKLLRRPCEECGCKKTQAHHHDYSKPLEVRWLCFKCHKLEHGHINVIR